MPIKGLSEIRRLPRLGKIRLGIRVKDPKTGETHPKAMKYFVSPPAVQAVYGAEPTELKIMLPVEDPDVFFPQWYKRWGSSTGLVCKGDGVTAVEVVNGYFTEKECLGRECPYFKGDPEHGIKKGSCKVEGTLNFLLPEIPGIGVWQVTARRNSVININSAIGPDSVYQKLCARLHVPITVLPLILKLGPQEVQAEGKKRTVYTLTVEAENAENIKLGSLRKALLIESQQIALPPPDETEPEDYDEAVEQNGAELSQPTEKAANAKPAPAPETAEPSAEEKADIHKQELLEMPVKERLELIYGLINQKHYTPPANTKTADKLTAKEQVEYVIFLEDMEGLPFK